jgi:hypothetical protein
MQLRLVPARQGVTWVRQGLQVFLRFPLPFTTLFLVFLFGAFMVAILPFVGVLALLILLPGVTLSFMIATRQSLAGRAPMPSVFADPFRGQSERTLDMVKLGVSYALASLGMMMLADWLDGGRFEALARGEAAAELVNDPQMLVAIAMRLSLTLPLSLLYWHAPALVHWCGVSAPKAVFFSLVACWRNKAAFTMYGIVWAGAVLLFGVVTTALFAVLGLPQLIGLAALPAALLFSTIFYISLYFTFADCFELEPGDLPPSGLLSGR